MNTPKISVVMPTLNRSGMIRHAIQSILDQTFDDWELIIIDDGSTEDVRGTVKLFKDKRIRYYRNKTNKGISYSRNRGNSLAKGKVIVVQDSDDMSFPDRLEEIWEFFEAVPSCDILYHWFYIRAIDIRYGAHAVHREIHRCGEYDKKRALSEPYIPGQLAYKKSVAKKCPYRKELHSWDDWGFIVDATMRDFKFYELQRPLYEYVISDDSITTLSDNSDMRQREMETMKKIMNEEYKLNVS